MPIMSTVLFCRSRIGHITRLHIHAKCEDLLNISAVISKMSFEQKGMLHQDYQSFQPKQMCKDTVAIGTHCSNGCKVFAVNFIRYDTV